MEGVTFKNHPPDKGEWGGLLLFHASFPFFIRNPPEFLLVRGDIYFYSSDMIDSSGRETLIVAFRSSPARSRSFSSQIIVWWWLVSKWVFLFFPCWFFACIDYDFPQSLGKASFPIGPIIRVKPAMINFEFLISTLIRSSMEPALGCSATVWRSKSVCFTAGLGCSIKTLSKIS